jgi:hypothetical protein
MIPPAIPFTMFIQSQAQALDVNIIIKQTTTAKIGILLAIG